MPPRKVGSKPAQKHEMEAFAERYETLVLIHGDPVDIAFAVMARSFNPGTVTDPVTGVVTQLTPNDELAKQTADMLMSYRFPRVKASEVVKPLTNPIQFNVTLQAAALAPTEVRSPQRTITVKAEEKKG